MSSLPRAAIYCRVSTNMQERDGTSLESQEAESRAYAASRGYIVSDGHVYREVASGGLLERGRLDDLRTALRSRELDVVLVHSFDRLSRNQAHTYILIDETERAGARIESVTEDFEDTAIGRFMRSTKAFVAEVEREKIKERTQRGLTTRIASGKPLAGGKPIYGYRWRDEAKSGLEVYEPEATIVRRIFRNLAEGGSAAYMTRTLNAEGVPSPKGSAWCSSTIGRLVRNEAFEGKSFTRKSDCPMIRSKAGRKYHAQILKPEAERVALPVGTIPAIVNPETAALARHILATNHQRIPPPRAKNPRDFLLRGGIIRCAICDHAMTGSQLGGPKERKVYRCQAAYRGDNVARHLSPQIERGLIDAAVWEQVILVRGNRDYVRQHLERQASQDITAAELASVDTALRVLAQQEANLLQAIRTAPSADVVAMLTTDAERLAAMKREAQSERVAILDRVAEAERLATALADFEATIDEDLASLDALTYEQRRAIVEGLGVQVRLWPNSREYPQRYEITMAFDISDWQDPAFYVGHDAADDELDEAKASGLVAAPVFRVGAQELRTATSTP